MLRNKLIPVNFVKPVTGLDSRDNSQFLSNRHWVIAEVLKYDIDVAKFYNHADELVAEWPCAEIEFISIPVLDEDSPVILAQKSSDYQAAVKKQRPNAWSRWTTEEEEQLRQHVARGLNYEEISDIHNRTPVAIFERLWKIGIDPGEWPHLGVRPEKRHYETLGAWRGKLPKDGETITVCLGCGYEIETRPCKCWVTNDTSRHRTWREHNWIYSMYGTKLRRREY
jgi:hypothetical protein